jgi:glycine/D-amino acid oxidase-like deaminating enzyme
VSTRCLVVGAGILGAATALRLAEAGAEVELIDADGPGAGTSGTSFAWVGASALGLWDYFDINVAGVAAHRRLGAELGATPWFGAGGSLQWYSDPGRQEALADRVLELRTTGYPAALISPGRALRLEPDLRLAESVEHVAFHADEGFVWARPMIAALLRSARARGVTTRWAARVVALEDRPDRAVAVLGSGERLDADAIVLCCGRWTSDVVKLTGADLPMIRADERGSVAVGLLVLTSPAVQSVERVLLADDLMIRPDGGGRLLLHSDEHDRLVDPRGDERVDEIAADVVESLSRHLDLVSNPTVDRAVIGIRALTGDLLPAVGWLPDSERIYVAVTHSGVTLGPLLGELIASELVDGVDERLLQPFRPARFSVGAEAPTRDRQPDLERAAPR